MVGCNSDYKDVVVHAGCATSRLETHVLLFSPRRDRTGTDIGYIKTCPHLAGSVAAVASVALQDRHKCLSDNAGLGIRDMLDMLWTYNVGDSIGNNEPLFHFSAFATVPQGNRLYP